MKKIEVHQQVVSLVREGKSRWLPESVDSAKAAAACFEHIQNLSHEEVWIVGLNSRGRPLGCVMIGRGGIAAAGLKAVDLLKPLIAMNAVSFVMAHNHPSGDSTPSTADIETTKTMLKAGHVVGIELFDHVVVSVNGWTSIREYEPPQRGRLIAVTREMFMTAMGLRPDGTRMDEDEPDPQPQLQHRAPPEIPGFDKDDDA